MIARSGRIVAIRDGLASIRVEPPAACTSCGSHKVCGGKAFELTRPVAAGARPGDSVTLAIAAGALTRGALLAYFLPAAMTLLGAAALSGGGDVPAVAGALAGLGLGLILLRLLGRRAACAPAVLPAPTFSPSDGDAS